MRTGKPASPPEGPAVVPAASVTHGQHACGVVAPGAQQQEVAVDFVAGGLRGGDRVWYLADADAPGQIVERLRAGGVDTDDALASGQLAVLPAACVLPGDGPSRADRLGVAIGQALASGYRGFRVTCEMSWAARAGASARRMTEFEIAVGQAVTGRPAAALCQYDPCCLAPGRLGSLVALHSVRACAPVISQYGRLRISVSCPDGAGITQVRLAGEADLFTSDALRRALAATVPQGADIHLDLSRLAFIDIAVARVLAGAAARLNPGRRMVLHEPPPALRRAIGLCWPDLDALEMESA